MDRNLTTRAVENAQNFYVFCGSLLNLRLLSFNFGVIGEEKEEKRRTGGRPREGGEAAKGARGPIRAVSPHFHMYWVGGGQGWQEMATERERERERERGWRVGRVWTNKTVKCPPLYLSAPTLTSPDCLALILGFVVVCVFVCSLSSTTIYIISTHSWKYL